MNLTFWRLQSSCACVLSIRTLSKSLLKIPIPRDGSLSAVVGRFALKAMAQLFFNSSSMEPAATFTRKETVGLYE